jgi:Glycosyl transferase family 2
MSRAGRPWDVARARAALGRRLRGPYEGFDRVEQQLAQLAERVGELEAPSAGLARIERQVEMLVEQVEELTSQVGRLHERAPLEDDLRHALRALAANEPRNRRSLEAARDAADYRRAWEEERPLVSVTVATLGRPELVSRSLPSILAQSHDELEVIVAGDGAPPQTEADVAALGDSRVQYLDLGPRQTWTDDPVKLWLVGATRARNAAVKTARGRWIVEFDDDDQMRPECLESLLELARQTGAEAVYGQVRQHGDGEPRDFCAFPPRLAHFSWAAGMYHGGLRFFGRELQAADLGLPGDWWLAERMLRAGVRFAMRDEVLCDAYASEVGRDALGRGRIPWSSDGDGRRWG